jgi:hypothetical protein
MVQFYPQLQASLVDHLHKQEFTLLVVKKKSYIMQTSFCSCMGPRASAWLLIRPTTPTFHLSSTHSLLTLHTHLGLPHPTVAHLSQC